MLTINFQLQSIGADFHTREHDYKAHPHRSQESGEFNQRREMPTAVITGANSGIANALAQILLKEVRSITSQDILPQ